MEEGKTITTTRMENGKMVVFPGHRFVRTWRFDAIEQEEAELANSVAYLAEKNGMSMDEVAHAFPLILRMLKSDCDWAGHKTAWTSMDAMAKTRELMLMKTKDIPAIARDYLAYISSIEGGCGEMIVTAFAHYCQMVLDLPCYDKKYEIDQRGRNWFAEKGYLYNSVKK